MPKQDAVFEQAINFLENGADLPPRVSNRFIAACLKQTHYEAQCAKLATLDNEKRIIRLETWQKWIKLSGAGGGIVGISALLIALLN